MSCAAVLDLLEGFTCTGTLTIDSIPLSTKGWSTTNLVPLWGLGPVRGSNVTIPGYPGEIPQPKRLTAFDVTLQMVVSGCHDAAGALYEDPFVGLQANCAFLDSFVAAQPLNTREAVLTMPDGSTRSGDVHVLRFQRGEPDGFLWRATLDISIPAGALT